MSTTQEETPLVNFLLDLERRQDRGALAALRSGIGKRPGEASRMFPYIARFLSAGGERSAQVQVVFLTSALFASHRSHAKVGNLGSSLRRAVTAKHGEEGVASRLTAALDADPEDLARHITGLVTLCDSAGAPIDWTRFYFDTISLHQEDEDRRNKTRLDWARGFWGLPQETAQDHATTENPS